MPNGISCAYFGIKNRIVGKKENNAFKEGIANIQGIRTADEVVKGVVNSGEIVTESVVKTATPLAKVLGPVANFAKKIIYPLIIASGVYDTVKAEDKVKTGVSTASAITTMYAFEQIAEKALNNFKTLSDKNVAVKGNKKLQFGLYAVRGGAFALASIAGYGIGKKSASEFVDELRAAKNKIKEKKTNKKTEVFSDMDAKKVSISV